MPLSNIHSDCFALGSQCFFFRLHNSISPTKAGGGGGGGAYTREGTYAIFGRTSRDWKSVLDSIYNL